MSSLRFLVLVVVGSAIVFGVIRGYQKKRFDDEYERKAQEEARQMPKLREQERQRQAEIAQRFHCTQARENMTVLEGAAAKGEGVMVFGSDGAKNMSPAEVSNAIFETKRYIEQNCSGQ